MDRQAKINLIALIILFGFSLSVFYHYILGAYLGMGYPYNTFLFVPKDKFMDFISTFRLTNSHPYASPYAFAESNLSQFPFWYVVAFLFVPFDERVATLLLLLFFGVSFVFICQANLQATRKASSQINLFIFAFLSFPFLVIIDRANFDFLAFILSFLFISLYYKYPRFSLVFLPLAIALKPQCAVFIILLLADKKYKKIIITGISAIALTLASYLALPGGLIQNITGHLKNLGLYNMDYAVGNAGLAFGNSLFGIIKVLALWTDPNIPPKTLFASMMTPYLLITVVIFIILVCYIVKIEQEFWKRIALLVFAMCLLPYVSGDNKLLYVFIPVFLFINNPLKDPHNWIYAFLLSLLLIPKDYYYFHIFSNTSISIVIDPVIMLIITAMIVVNGMKARFSGSKSES